MLQVLFKRIFSFEPSPAVWLSIESARTINVLVGIAGSLIFPKYNPKKQTPGPFSEHTVDPIVLSLALPNAGGECLGSTKKG